MNAKRKRNEAEQALWDQIEAEKQTLRGYKATRDSARDCLLVISSDASDEAGIRLLRDFVAARDAVFSVETKVARLEREYRELRAKDES